MLIRGFDVVPCMPPFRLYSRIRFDGFRHHDA